MCNVQMSQNRNKERQKQISLALIEPDGMLCKERVQLTAAALKHAQFQPSIYSFADFNALRSNLLQAKHSVDILVLPADDEGYSFGEELRRIDRNCALIYIADSMKPVLRAFRSAALGYVVDWRKEKQRYAATLIRVAQYMAEGISEIEFMSKSRLLRFRLKEIDYFESDYRLVHIHCSNGACETIKERLDCIEVRILSGFFRCHQSYLVNLENISSVDRTTRRIEFYSGQQIYASKALFSSFLEQYNRK